MLKGHVANIIRVTREVRERAGERASGVLWAYSGEGKKIDSGGPSLLHRCEPRDDFGLLLDMDNKHAPHGP